MVSMSRELTLSFGAQLQTLEQFLRANGSRLSPEVGFAAYVFNSARQNCSFLGNLAALVSEPRRLSEAPVLAATGYLRSIRVKGPNLPCDVDWRAALKKLSQLEAFPADRSAFTYRPLEVLGICLGQMSDEKADAELAAWLNNVLTRLLEQEHSEAWTRWLYRLAGQTLGITGARQFSSQLELLTLTEIAVDMWNHAPRMIQPVPQLSEDEMRQLLSYLWMRQFVYAKGDAGRGKQVFAAKRCADCHNGGEHGAPQLPGQGRGYSEITIVSALWKHGPQMFSRMREAKMAWPRFNNPQQMTDLVAYLNTVQ